MHSNFGSMEHKIVEATMAERKSWEGRLMAAENRWEAAIDVTIAMGGDTKLVRKCTRPCTLQLQGTGREGREGYAPLRPEPQEGV